MCACAPVGKWGRGYVGMWGKIALLWVHEHVQAFLWGMLACMRLTRVRALVCVFLRVLVPSSVRLCLVCAAHGLGGHVRVWVRVHACARVGGLWVGGQVYGLLLWLADGTGAPWPPLWRTVRKVYDWAPLLATVDVPDLIARSGTAGPTATPQLVRRLRTHPAHTRDLSCGTRGMGVVCSGHRCPTVQLSGTESCHWCRAVSLGRRPTRGDDPHDRTRIRAGCPADPLLPSRLLVPHPPPPRARRCRPVCPPAANRVRLAFPSAASMVLVDRGCRP
jgi:hypothetical protein